jgi:hypothetical protein
MNRSGVPVPLLLLCRSLRRLQDRGYSPLSLIKVIELAAEGVGSDTGREAVAFSFVEIAHNGA